RRPVPAASLAAGRRALGVLERTGSMAPASLAGRAPRRDLGRTRALDAGACRLPARDRRQRGRSRRAGGVLRADGRRMASLRHALRALRNAQPRAAAELSELALAAALSAAVRARDLPA